MGIVSFLNVGHAWYSLWTEWKVEQSAIKNMMWEGKVSVLFGKFLVDEVFLETSVKIYKIIKYIDKK